MRRRFEENATKIKPIKTAKDYRAVLSEIEGLMQNLLYVDSPPTSATRFTEWIKSNKDKIGRHYTSELARRTDRIMQYQSN